VTTPSLLSTGPSSSSFAPAAALLCHRRPVSSWALAPLRTRHYEASALVRPAPLGLVWVEPLAGVRGSLPLCVFAGGRRDGWPCRPVSASDQEQNMAFRVLVPWHLFMYLNIRARCVDGQGRSPIYIPIPIARAIPGPGIARHCSRSCAPQPQFVRRRLGYRQRLRRATRPAFPKANTTPNAAVMSMRARLSRRLGLNASKHCCRIDSRN